MCRAALLLVALAVFTPTTSVSAQEEAGDIARAFVVKAKPGMEQKFEEAYKKHIAWHEQQNDDWTWDTWQFQTGERFGQYMIRTEDHHWQDFDATADFQVADGKHFTDTAAVCPPIHPPSSGSRVTYCIRVRVRSSHTWSRSSTRQMPRRIGLSSWL